MTIHLTRTVKFNSSKLRKVWESLVLPEGPLIFQLKERPLFFEEDEFDWDIFFNKVDEYRTQQGVPESEYIVVITELSNNRNWFSAADEQGRNNIFVHGSGWENFIYCDSVYPIAYEVVANILQRTLFVESSDLAHTHDPAIGCMNDMCSWKPDVSLKLRTGDMCQDCLQWAKDKGLSDQVIVQALQIFALLRPKMLQSAPLQSYSDFDQHLPFNVAVTKRKISSTGEPLRKFLFLIDHFDSMIRTAVLFWASQVFSDREQQQAYFSEKGLLGRPSLGTWLSVLFDITRNYPTDLQLNNSISRKVHRIIQISEQNDIVSRRNEMRGHGYIHCNDSDYRKVFMELQPAVQEIEDLLTPLFSANKLRYVNFTSLEGPGFFRILFLELSGSYAVYTEKTHSVTTTATMGLPVNDRVYLFNTQEEKWFEVSPWFLFQLCPKCIHQRLLVYDSDGLYLDPLEGHIVSI